MSEKPRPILSEVILKIVKNDGRYFFAKNGKEWEIEKFFDHITEEGVNTMKIEVVHDHHVFEM